MPLTDETRTKAREIIARYPKPRSALLPMLHLVQAEEGYVTPAGIGFCAEELGLTKAEVGAVATFYTMYKRRPTGEYLVSVCTNTLCALLGGDEIYATLKDELGVGHNQTTEDGSITLEHAECLAACDFAPVVTVNYEYFDQQSPESALAVTQELRGGRRPLPTRGAPLCSFKEISLQLAGFMDERPEARDAVSIGEPSLVGVKLALDRGETAPSYDAPSPNGKAAGSGGAAAASGAAQSTGTPAKGGQTSAHDEPQQTAESDPHADPAKPAGESGTTPAAAEPTPRPATEPATATEPAPAESAAAPPPAEPEVDNADGAGTADKPAARPTTRRRTPSKRKEG
jgi:NADH-quinone oxidoreductase subunit E